MAGKKIKTFGDGVPYIEPGGGALTFTWLIDFVMFVLLFGVGALIALRIGEALDLSNNAVALGVLATLFVTPLVYGLFYTNGRALGAVCTGTRLVRASDGGRIGAKGPWAMLVRTILLPLLIIAVVVGGGYADGSLKRISIDEKRTRALQESGYPATPR
ncbi:hypothetical protein K3N28_14930 [Glycomyces sp. TRM65418]|uniref:RDD family protein n=1 Tax=Glycomyces sp. TRM65418 TaxID=2867006 RepID=UPI001CE4D8FD|nr:RDD family protein [Glycomyces sp. TRM65418]MCC3764358.1 hypothetical protein [Glycomyces sp. TRM65418]QZD54037.1 hypothetical protein K3N28_14855 [Glycomyces sp. TRM65418]